VCEGLEARAIRELGIGTGETARPYWSATLERR
jgi:hypothetical protein